MDKVYSHTIALCPECREKVNARIIERVGKIYLEKFCKTHGITFALICSDAGWYQESRKYIKPIQYPLEYSIDKFTGCNDSCGLCPEHLQHSCMPIIEITSNCNLKCPVCLKNPDLDFELTIKEFQNILLQLKRCEGEIPVINLSGGEPLVHPEIEEILETAAGSGVIQTTVSTNGIELLHDKEKRKLFKDLGVIVALQFDGFRPETYIELRGKNIAEEKLDLINTLEAEGIKYSLVSTVLKNINDMEITGIVNFFFRSKALSLMFQPVSFNGRAKSLRSNENVITIPDIINEIEKSKFIKKGDFNPLPCSHYSCFALSYYLSIGEDKFMSLKDFLGKENYLNVISNKSLPGLDKDGYSMMKEKLYDLWSASDSSISNEVLLKRIRSIIEKLNRAGFSPKEAFDIGTESMKAVFIHQFMDIHSFDFGRIIKCCNHYPRADGRFIPMCAQNLI